MKRLMHVLMVVAILVIGSAGLVYAKDYWVYTNSQGMQFYVNSEGSDFRPGYGDKHAFVKIVMSNDVTVKEDWHFGFDEGEWYYKLRGKKGTSMLVRDHPQAQAILNFCLAHWTKQGFVE